MSRSRANRHRVVPDAEVLSRRRLLEGLAEIEAYAGAGTWSITYPAVESVWSPGLYRLLDVEPLTFAASRERLLRHVHAEDRAVWEAEFDAAIAEHIYFERSHRIVTGSGRTRVVLSRAFAQYDEATGAPLYVVGTMVDVTNSQLVRKKLDDATAQLMAVWEHVQEGLVLVALDRTIVDCNPFLEQLVGRTRAELIRTDVIALRPAELREAGYAFFARASIEPVRDIEAIVERPDGLRIQIEISSSGSFHLGERSLVLGTYRDVTARKRAERIVARRAMTEACIARANSAIVRANEREELLRVVCSEIVGDGIVLATVGEPLHDDRKSCRFIAAAGPASGYLDSVEIVWDERSPNGQGPFGRCARTRAPARGFVTDPAFAPWRANAERWGIGASLAIPVVDGDFLAVYTLYVNDAGFFQDDEIALYESLSGDLSLALRALRSRDEALAAATREHERAIELDAALEGALAAVSTTLEKRDPYTAGHQRRVAELTRLIAEQLQFDPDRTRGLYLAALVHDIGKIAIPSEILTKPSRFTALEYEYVKQHSQFSADIVASIPFRWPIREIVLQHHEYLDGSGYPRGLQGDEILFESRILTVADIVESMTAIRPYHAPSGVEGALDEIRRMSGTKLEPAAVEACAAVFAAGSFSVPALVNFDGTPRPHD